MGSVINKLSFTVPKPLRCIAGCLSQRPPLFTTHCPNSDLSYSCTLVVLRNNHQAHMTRPLLSPPTDTTPSLKLPPFGLATKSLRTPACFPRIEKTGKNYLVLLTRLPIFRPTSCLPTKTGASQSPPAPWATPMFLLPLPLWLPRLSWTLSVFLSLRFLCLELCRLVKT
jgi:hypothetical protein